MDESGKDSKPKYFTDLFILLRVIFECPDVAKLDDVKAMWEPLKSALPSFMIRAVGKSKELKKSYLLLARALQISQVVPAAVTVDSSLKTAPASTDTAVTVAVADVLQVDSKSDKRTEKKGTKESYEASKNRKEAKKRRMAAAAEGVDDITFTEIDISEVDPTFDGEEEPKRKKKKQVNECATEGNELELPVQAKPAITKKKKNNKKVASVTVVEEVEKSTLNGSTATGEDCLITTVDSSDKPVETEKNAKKKKKKAS